MPLYDPHSALMGDEIHYALVEIPHKSAIGDLPHFDRAVLGGTGYYIVIVGTPLDVQDRGRVTSDQRGISLYTSDLQEREHRISLLFRIYGRENKIVCFL